MTVFLLTEATPIFDGMRLNFTHERKQINEWN